MRIPWKNPKQIPDTKKGNGPYSPEFISADITARYFLLDKGCPGDTKTLVKFDGSYWRWIPYDGKWSVDQTLTKEDWFCGHLQGITKEEAEKILNS
jgi:hypothetical protein